VILRERSRSQISRRSPLPHGCEPGQVKWMGHEIHVSVRVFSTCRPLPGIAALNTQLASVPEFGAPARSFYGERIKLCHHGMYWCSFNSENLLPHIHVSCETSLARTAVVDFRKVAHLTGQGSGHGSQVVGQNPSSSDTPRHFRLGGRASFRPFPIRRATTGRSLLRNAFQLVHHRV